MDKPDPDDPIPLPDRVIPEHPVWFCRHGETDWNRDKRCQGLTDIPLNATGEVQARAYGRYLAPLLAGHADIAYIASPLDRAKRTMELIREGLGLPARGFETDDRLVEIDHGDWGGFTYDEIRARWPDDYAAMQQDRWRIGRPGGESYADRLEAVTGFLQDLAARNQPVLLVGHGGSGRVLRSLVAGHPPSQVVHMPMSQDQFYAFDQGRETIHLCRDAD